jgi:hypothetical protein
MLVALFDPDHVHHQTAHSIETDTRRRLLRAAHRRCSALRTPAEIPGPVAAARPAGGCWSRPWCVRRWRARRAFYCALRLMTRFLPEATGERYERGRGGAAVRRRAAAMGEMDRSGASVRHTVTAGARPPSPDPARLERPSGPLPARARAWCRRARQSAPHAPSLQLRPPVGVVRSDTRLVQERDAGADCGVHAVIHEAASEAAWSRYAATVIGRGARRRLATRSGRQAGRRRSPRRSRGARQAAAAAARRSRAAFRPVGVFTTDDRGSVDMEIQEGELRMFAALRGGPPQPGRQPAGFIPACAGKTTRSTSAPPSPIRTPGAAGRQ